MDEPTLRSLIKEAKKNLKRSTYLFEEWDNSEDMHEMNTWAVTVKWLESKLSKISANRK